MSWHNSTKNLSENVEVFFSKKEISLDLLCELAAQRDKAKKELEKVSKRTEEQGLHASKSAKVKHMSCAEDLSYKEMLLDKCVELLRQQYHNSEIKKTCDIIKLPYPSVDEVVNYWLTRINLTGTNRTMLEIGLTESLKNYQFIEK